MKVEDTRDPNSKKGFEYFWTFNTSCFHLGPDITECKNKNIVYILSCFKVSVMVEEDPKSAQKEYLYIALPE